MDKDIYTQYIEKEEILNYPLLTVNDRPIIHYTYKIECSEDFIDSIVNEWLKEKFEF